MGVKVKGIKRSVQRMDNIVNDITNRKSVRAVQAAMLIGATQASIYTPIDTSTLLNSQFREPVMISGTRVTGRVGYSANYAAYVADPRNPMKFRRSTAKKDFLNKGFEDSSALILQAIKKEMSL